MAYNFALNRIKREKTKSFRKLKNDAIDYKTNKPVTEEKKQWHRGKISGLKLATSCFYAGQKAGYSKGRKAGFKSGRMYGSMMRRSYRTY
jgi:hypothetical protein